MSVKQNPEIRTYSLTQSASFRVSFQFIIFPDNLLLLQESQSSWIFEPTQRTG